MKDWLMVSLIVFVNLLLLTLGFGATAFVPALIFIVVPLLTVFMTVSVWWVWRNRFGDIGKQKRNMSDNAETREFLNDIETRLARLETIAAAGYVNGQREDRAELEERLARLETIAAAEHLSDHPEDWDQIDIKRKRGLN